MGPVRQESCWIENLLLAIGVWADNSVVGRFKYQHCIFSHLEVCSENAVTEFCKCIKVGKCILYDLQILELSYFDDKPERFESIESLLQAVRELQHYAMIRQQLKSG